MGKGNFSEDFKRDASRQITERGYPASEVSQRLGMSAHLLYTCRKNYGSEVPKMGIRPMRTGS